MDLQGHSSQDNEGGCRNLAARLLRPYKTSLCNLVLTHVMFTQPNKSCATLHDLAVKW